MKTIIHFKGILYLMNPNYDYDNFWLHRFLHPEVVLHQMEAVSHKVRRKNVDRSAKKKACSWKGTWRSLRPACSGSKNLKRLRDRLEVL